MKILYTGPYRDGTGWAHAAINWMKVLDRAGYEVVARPIKLNSHKEPLDPEIEKFERRIPKGAKINIQNILPHMMSYNGDMINVALCMFESSNFKHTSWAEYLNMMDAVVVPCRHNLLTCKNSNIHKPTYNLPIPCDIGVYNKRRPKLPGIKDDDKFSFYFVGEFTKRKNLRMLLQAFHTEFDIQEPVELVIKTTPAGLGNNPQQFIENYLVDTRNGIKKYADATKYKREKIVCEYWSDEKLYELHQTLDCFVCSSHAEAWCIPAFDALGFGKTPICPAYGGFLEYLNDTNGWLVDCYQDDCYGHVEGFADLYTSQEQWSIPIVSDLRKKMREAYENKELREAKASNALSSVTPFDINEGVVEQTYSTMRSIVDGSQDW